MLKKGCDMKKKELYNMMAEAIKAVEAEDMESAREKFTVLEKEGANDAQVLYNVALFYSQTGDHLHSAEVFQRVCELTPDNRGCLIKKAVEEYHIGGGAVFQTDFLAYDATYLLRAKESCEKLLEAGEDKEVSELLKRVESAITRNRCAFKYMDGDLEYCRTTLTRKKELTNLDERVIGFLNLLDSGDYEYVKGKFGPVKKDNISEPQGGFLERIRNWVLGK
jgi:tetratricopeptide (TPR) repeat protein